MVRQRIIKEHYQRSMVSQQSNTNGGSLKRSLAADFTNEDLGSVDERYVNGPTGISSQFNINDNLNAVV